MPGAQSAVIPRSPRTVCVRNLPSRVTVRRLRHFALELGLPEPEVILPLHNTGCSRGYAFLRFATASESRQFMHAAAGRRFCAESQKCVVVELARNQNIFSKPRRPPPPPPRGPGPAPGDEGLLHDLWEVMRESGVHRVPGV